MRQPSVALPAHVALALVAHHAASGGGVLELAQVHLAERQGGPEELGCAGEGLEDRVLHVDVVALRDAVPVADFLVEDGGGRLAGMDVEVLAQFPAAAAELVALQELRRAEGAGAKEDARGLDLDQALALVVRVQKLRGQTFDHTFFHAQIADPDFAVDVGAVLDRRRQEVLVHRPLAADRTAELADAAADAAGRVARDEVALEPELFRSALEDQRIAARDLGADLLHVERFFHFGEERLHPLRRPGRAEVALPLAQHAVGRAEADGAVDERAPAHRAAGGERDQDFAARDHHAPARIEMAEGPGRLAHQIGGRERAAFLEHGDLEAGPGQLGRDRRAARARADDRHVGAELVARLQIGGGMQAAGQHQFSARVGVQPSVQPQAERASSDSK